MVSVGFSQAWTRFVCACRGNLITDCLTPLACFLCGYGQVESFPQHCLITLRQGWVEFTVDRICVVTTNFSLFCWSSLCSFFSDMKTPIRQFSRAASVTSCDGTPSTEGVSSADDQSPISDKASRKQLQFGLTARQQQSLSDEDL